MNFNRKHIYIVDDEPGVLKSMAWTLKQLGCQVSTFTDARQCLQTIRNERECSLLVTDVRMSGMDGVELLIEVKRIMPTLPVLIISGFADVPMTVTVMKAGADDLIEKPLNKEDFVKKVKWMLEEGGSKHYLADDMLTKTEKIIFRLILDAKTNKEIAKILHRSVRTIEVHRANMRRKLHVDNVVDLIRKYATLAE